MQNSSIYVRKRENELNQSLDICNPTHNEICVTIDPPEIQETQNFSIFDTTSGQTRTDDEERSNGERLKSEITANSNLNLDLSAEDVFTENRKSELEMQNNPKSEQSDRSDPLLQVEIQKVIQTGAKFGQKCGHGNRLKAF